MAGYILPVIAKTVIDFSSLAIGATQEYSLAEQVALTHWREATLVVTVRSHTLAGGSGTITIGARGQSRSAEDPGLDFVDTSVFYNVVLNSGTAATAFVVCPLNVDHPMVKVVAQGNRLASGTLQAIVSIYLAVKDG
jgi:hypothetical protein